MCIRDSPLSEIAKSSGKYISRGVSVDSLDTEKLWETHITVKEGDVVRGGTIIAEIQETPAVLHRAMVPPVSYTHLSRAKDSGRFHWSSSSLDHICNHSRRQLCRRAWHVPGRADCCCDSLPLPRIYPKKTGQKTNSIWWTGFKIIKLSHGSKKSFIAKMHLPFRWNSFCFFLFTFSISFNFLTLRFFTFLFLYLSVSLISLFPLTVFFLPRTIQRFFYIIQRFSDFNCTRCV